MDLSEGSKRKADANNYEETPSSRIRQKIKQLSINRAKLQRRPFTNNHHLWQGGRKEVNLDKLPVISQ